ncbi:MAG TPA: porin family protein [Lentimicrobium sp.]|nr:porin family protein [Lentimicrobium sp.]
MNKKLLYILSATLLLFLEPGTLKAQRIMGALIAGVNATQVDGDEVFGYHKFGLNVGAAAIVPLKGNWSFSIETLYNEKGSHQRPRYVDSLDGSYDLKLNYLDVPVLVHYSDKDIVTFGLGASWGGLVKVEEQRNGIEMPGTTLNSGIYNSSDINLLMDVKFRLVQRLRFNVRYAYSIVPIATREVIDSKTGYPNVRKQYNGMFTFRLYYVFNERLSERAKKNQPVTR